MTCATICFAGLFLLLTRCSILSSDCYFLCPFWTPSHGCSCRCLCHGDITLMPLSLTISSINLCKRTMLLSNDSSITFAFTPSLSHFVTFILINSLLLSFVNRPFETSKLLSGKMRHECYCFRRLYFVRHFTWLPSTLSHLPYQVPFKNGTAFPAFSLFFCQKVCTKQLARAPLPQFFVWLAKVRTWGIVISGQRAVPS